MNITKHISPKEKSPTVLEWERLTMDRRYRYKDAGHLWDMAVERTKK